MSENTFDAKPFELTLPALVVARDYRTGLEFLAVRGLHPSNPGVALVSEGEGDHAIVRAMQGRRGTTLYVVDAWIGDYLARLALTYGLDVVQVVP